MATKKKIKPKLKSFRISGSCNFEYWTEAKNEDEAREDFEAGNYSDSDIEYTDLEIDYCEEE